MTDQELAAELRDLADHPWLVTRRAQLRELSRAITDSDQAERWCEVDLFSAFSAEDTVLPEEVSRKPVAWFRRADSFVGPGLVFLPILVTWLGLKAATTAYGQALAAGGPEVARRPFLEMWQQGFDGRLAGFFKFDNIALCTLLAIGAVIAWTITASRTRDSQEDRMEHELTNLRARLRGALTEASLVLGQVRLSSPARFTAELTKAAAELTSVSTAARQVQTDLVETAAKAQADLTETMTRTRADLLTTVSQAQSDLLTTVSRTQSELVDALTRSQDAGEKTAQTLAASATDMQRAVDVLGRRLAEINVTCDDMTAAMEHASAAIDAAGSTTGQAVGGLGERLATAVSETTLELRQAFNDEVARTMTSVQSTLGELDTRVAELVNATAGIGYAVDRAADSIDSVGASTEKAVGLIGGQVSDTLAMSAAEFQRTFGTTSAEIRDALGEWSVTAGAHASRIELVSDASGRTITLLEQARDTFDRLPAALADALAELPGKVRDLTDGEFTELREAITELEHAVDRAADAFTASAPKAPKAPEVRKGTLW
ncbi:hypothetical protein [Planomonospora parontospora]|uniref:hypothetical protein n=1 Tax=Planomonospora parontospora TaxID=58119 RepID=UPI00166F953A|nr:hypothetical protein [Planomonospora parontospora]GGL56793.1 hypothetical protein GCM10014719_67730 [Planomonospora parontospora subsp. antibiotica]GII19981.1 hypothetical protein Ppa05_67070 [Planomonospora parontospora subsp. antibiotica]